MKKYIAVLELEADEESIEADIRYNYSSDGEDYSVLDCVWFNEENKEEKKKTYEDGLNEAWELARKIVCRETDGGKPIKWVEDTFGSVRTDIVLRNYAASEAIEQAKEHEDIKIGDEVKYLDLVGVVISEGSEEIIEILWSNGRTDNRIKQEVIKTERHFSQIEEILNKLKEKNE